MLSDTVSIDEIVTIDDEDDEPETKRPNGYEGQNDLSKRRSRRDRGEISDDDYMPAESRAKKMAKSLKKPTKDLLAITHADEGVSQRKRPGSPTANPKYQKATRRPSPQREGYSGMNHRVSNDTIAQMLGVLMARVEKLECDRKKIAPLEEKVTTIVATQNSIQAQLAPLREKVEEGVGTGAICNIMEQVDKIKLDVIDTRTVIDGLNGRVDNVDMWKDTTDVRLTGLKVKTKSVWDGLRNIEQARNNDSETLESHSQKLSSLERSIHDVEKASIPLPSSPNFQSTNHPLATPEQLQQLFQLPVLNQNKSAFDEVLPFVNSSIVDIDNITPSIQNIDKTGGLVDEEFIPSEFSLSDILNDLDSSSSNLGDNTFQIISPQHSDLPLFSLEEEDVDALKPTENNISVSSSTSGFTSKQADASSANSPKPPPIKISLLKFKKENKSTEEKQDNEADLMEKGSNSEINRLEGTNSTNMEMGIPSIPKPHETLNKESSQTDGCDNTESGASDSSANKPKNKFFTSKNR